MPDVKSLRIPVQYLANLLTAGRTEPVELRAGADAGDARATCAPRQLTASSSTASPSASACPATTSRRCISLMAIANYEDRFVIPTAHRETGEDAYQLRGSCGFSFGDGCSGKTGFNLFGAKKPRAKTPDGGGVMARTYRALGALLSYPTEALQAATGEIAAVLADEGHRCRATARPAIGALLAELATTDIYELQERYFALFDRSRDPVAASVRACAWRKP